MTIEYTANQLTAMSLTEIGNVMDGYMQVGDMENYVHCSEVLRDLYQCWEDRKNEYPPIEEFLDAYAKDDEVALQEYKDKCMAVKNKYPKPGES
jgi:ATP-dependent exoDNAse (exonuclease V) beta subunit